ncbi:MAG: ABC transporter permease [Anaerolineales bacterium]|jgi:peptide/nickel transport system permease protein
MYRYILRRLFYAIPVLLGILLVIFVLVRLIPGEPCKAMLGEKATEETCERFNAEHGLDKPIYEQFVIYLERVARLDLGNSIRMARPVTLVLVERLPTTIELTGLALALAIVVGISMGVVSAMRHNTAVDVTTMIGANIGVSMPVFWLGLMLQYVFAKLLKNTFLWLPPSGRLTAGLRAVPFYEHFGWQVAADSARFKVMEFFANLYIFNSIVTFNWEVLLDTLKHLILPAVALSTIPMAIIARMTRSSLLEVMGEDYIRTARGKGVRELWVVMRHGLRNALLPVVTIIGLQLGALLAGAVLTETIFGLSGVGRALFDAILARDYPIIQAFTLVIATSYVLINLLVDVSYTFLDPRVRLD